MRVRKSVFVPDSEYTKQVESTNMMLNQRSIGFILFPAMTVVALLTTAAPAAESDPLSESTDELIIEEETEAFDMEFEDSESLSIEDEDPAADELDIDPSTGEDRVEEEMSADTGASPDPGSGRFFLKMDDLWAEYGRFTDSQSEAQNQGYLHGQATARWIPDDSWELQLSARVDGYYQWSGQNTNRTRLDYDESFVRYRGEDFRVTAGALKVVWGLIDELPPTDRMSTVDLSRFILDDLVDRRRANPAVRFESFFADSKLDLLWLPVFREAVLPDEKNVWYPINRTTGKTIGLKTTPALSAVVKSAPIDEDAPNTDGGFGARFTGTKSELDYGLTLQRVRQSTPYFRYNTGRGVIEAQYPRTWVAGGELGFETDNGITWRFEGAWNSDTPVTEVGGVYTTVNSVNWGGAMEFYPGDGDARVVFQLTGFNLINSPKVLDRKKAYSFNGSLESPFSQNRWRAKARFYFGLDKKDIYVNPDIAYIAWEPHEIYLAAHYFDGRDGTPGGFHEDHSLVTLGWRTRF